MYYVVQRPPPPPPPKPTLFVKSTSACNYVSPHLFWVNALVTLEDGSFVSCSDDHTAKRWLLIDDNAGGHKTIQHVGLMLDMRTLY